MRPSKSSQDTALYYALNIELHNATVYDNAIIIASRRCTSIRDVINVCISANRVDLVKELLTIHPNSLTQKSMIKACGSSIDMFNLIYSHVKVIDDHKLAFYSRPLAN